jgi:ABC-type amino acid transport substrate-binding protein
MRIMQGSRTDVARAVRIAALALAASLVAGCGMLSAIPVDPDGTLAAVSGGTLAVGVSPNPPFTDVSGDAPTGTEVALVESFAASLGAEVSWTVGGEEELVRQLQAGQLDLVIGGITDATPWSLDAAVTRPYAEVAAADGSTQRLVMLAPLGENAFLSALERHLDGEAGAAP